MILGFMLVDTNAMIFGMPTALFPALAVHQFHHAGYSVPLRRRGRGALALGCSAAGSGMFAPGLVVVAAAVWGGAIAAFGFTSSLGRAGPARARRRRRPSAPSSAARCSRS